MKTRKHGFRSLVLVIGLMIVSAVTVAGAPPYPTALAANVDGNSGEWDLTNDFFANMYLAANSSNPVLAKLYLRYSCGGPGVGTLYALVLAQPGYMIDMDAGTDYQYVKINNVKYVDEGVGDDGVPPDFAWVGINSTPAQTAGGWEASATVNAGSYTDLNVHAQIYIASDPGGDTSAVENRAIPLNLVCNPTAVTLTDFKSTPTQDYTWIVLGTLGVWGLMLSALRMGT